MTVLQQLTDDMKTAMKAHDSASLEVIRFLRAEIKNAQIDGAGDDDASVQKVIASQVKKTTEAVQEFQNAGRADLAASEQAKIAIMQKYLPAQLSDEQLEQIAREVIASSGEVKNSGQLIGQVMKKVAGQADGARVKALVERLTAA